MKNLFKMNLLFILSAVFISNLSFGQDKVDVNTINSESSTLLYSGNGLIFSAIKEECNINPGQKPFVFAFLEIENTTDQAITVVYSIGLHYSTGTCEGCNQEPEYTYALTIPANSSVKGDCNFDLQGTHVTLDNPNLEKLYDLLALNINNLEIR